MKINNYIRSMFMTMLLIFTVGASASSSRDVTVNSVDSSTATEITTANAIQLGRWQIITEGPVGSGDGLYLLDFYADGRLTVEFQNAHRNVIDEKTWEYKDGYVLIHTKSGDQIQEFIGHKVSLIDEDTMRVFVEGKDVNITKNNALSSWTHLILFFIGSILLYELSRKSRVVMISLFVIAPIVLLPYWINYSGIYAWFKWAKLYSPIVHGLFFILMVQSDYFRKKWVRFTIAALFIINIGEAIGQDFSIGHLPNILNGLAGIFCILAVTRWAGIDRDNSKEKDVLWPGMTVAFILVYDVWNITFVYLSFPDLTSIQIAVLSAATLPALFIKKGTWMQARIFTLSIFMMYAFSFKTFVEVNTVAVYRTDNSVLAVAAFSCAVNLIYLLFYWRWKYLNKAPKYVEVGQNEVAYKTDDNAPSLA